MGSFFTILLQIKSVDSEKLQTESPIRKYGLLQSYIDFYPFLRTFFANFFSHSSQVWIAYTMSKVTRC